jgi:hypothetical protein
LDGCGHTEAAIDLARLAGLYPAGVICEIVNDDGTMACVTDLVSFCQLHDLKMITVADLARYRLELAGLSPRSPSKSPTSRSFCPVRSGGYPPFGGHVIGGAVARIYQSHALKNRSKVIGPPSPVEGISTASFIADDIDLLE